MNDTTAILTTITLWNIAHTYYNITQQNTIYTRWYTKTENLNYIGFCGIAYLIALIKLL